jgi:hypothetical protein
MIKTRYLVRTKLNACDLLGDIFDNLRGWRDTSITKPIDMLNEDFFLYIRKPLPCI